MRRLDLRTARWLFLLPWLCTMDDGCAALDSVGRTGPSSVKAVLSATHVFVPTVGPRATSPTLVSVSTP